MKKLFLTILATLFLMASTAFAGDYCVELNWTAPPEPDVAGYLVYARLDGGVYDFNSPKWQGSETTCQILMEDFKVWYFAIKAYDTAGKIGPTSDEVSWDTTPAWFDDAPSKATDPQIGQCSG